MPPPLSHLLEGGHLGGAGSDFVIVEWTDAGDSESEWIAPLHLHCSDDAAWYVLDATMRFRIGGETFESEPPRRTR